MSHKKPTKAEMPEYLKKALGLRKQNAESLTAVLYSATGNKSIKLAQIAKNIPKKVKPKSKTRQLQRFFKNVRPDPEKIARLVMELANINPEEQIILAIDRTEWKKRQDPTNLLILSSCMGDTGIPLFCKNLHYEGNSNTDQRIEMVKQFTSVFGAKKIKCIAGDREFIGEEWFTWMKTNDIPFVMRLRENFLVGKRKKAVKDFFKNLPNGKSRNLGLRRICGVTLYVYGVKTKSGDLIILGSRGISGQEAIVI